jgi:hypothetical protein
MEKGLVDNLKKIIPIALGSIALASLFTIPFFNNHKKEEILIESTESHDVIFGKSLGALSFKNENKLVGLSNDYYAPKIGYQSALSSDGTKISIRYVCAIDSQDYDSAVWSRSLYDSSGDYLNVLAKKDYTVTTTYTGITNGGVITYANELEDEDGDHPYTRFVVYTLLDIPSEDYSSAYLDAHVSLIKDGNIVKQSKVGALKVDQEDYFSYTLASDSLVFNVDTENKSYIVTSDTSSGSIIVPEYYSDGDHRYNVSKIEDNAFSDKEKLTLVLPKSIDSIGLNAVNSNATICYMGTKEEWNNISITNSGINFTHIKYLDKSLSKCNSFYLDSNNDITFSNEDHEEDTPKVENVTATCSNSGTYDSVTYCKNCGIELNRTTHSMEALGHNYDEYEETNSLGHSYIVHECLECGDIYYNSLVTDYTKTYEYKTFTEDDYYNSYNDDVKGILDSLYEGCMEMFNSTSNYTPNWNGNSQVLVAEAHYSNNISDEVAWGIANYFIDNNPHFYFVSDSILYGNGVYLVLDSTYYTCAARKDINDKLKDMEEDFTRGYLSSNLSTDVSKAKYIHDYIANNLYYQYEEDGKTPSDEAWAHHIVGFIDQNPNTGGVCECYAKVYLYLSRLVGINTITVVGYAGSTTIGGHAWNYTQIDGKWYGVDVTWDDQGTILYDFFLVSKGIMEDAGNSWRHATHIPSESNIASYPEGSTLQVLLPELEDSSAFIA